MPRWGNLRGAFNSGFYLRRVSRADAFLDRHPLLRGAAAVTLGSPCVHVGARMGLSHGPMASLPSPGVTDRELRAVVGRKGPC